MAVEIHSFFHEDTCTFSYVAWDPATGNAAVIDPVLDYDAAGGNTDARSVGQVADFIAARDLRVQWILETHAHADHLSAAPWLKSRFPGSQLAIGAGIRSVQSRFKEIFNLQDLAVDGSQFDQLLEDGDRLPLGRLEIEVIATPGHTSDSLTYLIEDAAFVGDSIFMPDMGTARCDFPGGDAATLHASIQRLFQLPGETRLYMCHDYAPGGRDYRNVTTVAEERAANIHVGEGRGVEEFRELREQRDATLGAPRLLYPSVQANIRAGELPPPESNGSRYFKIPLNAFRQD